MNAKFFGSSGAIAFVSPQGLGNEYPLHLFESYSFSDIGGFGAVFYLESCRQMLSFYYLILAQYETMLNNVLKLTHIARIAIAQKNR